MNAFTEAGLDEAFYEALCPAPSPRIECATAAPRKATCTFAEMMPLFQELFEPDPTRFIALGGRFKFLLKNGAAAGAQRGRGKPAEYTAADVMELLFTMEATEIGLSPAKAVALYKDNLPLKFPYRVAVGNGSHIQIGVPRLHEAAAKHLPWMFSDKEPGNGHR